MSLAAWLIGSGAFAISVALTGLVRRSALSSGLLDVPNQRSSHSVPTPRGGGVAIVVASMLALLALWILSRVPSDLFVALVVGGGAVAGIGYLDDRRPLSARLRIAVHFAAALWAIACMSHWSVPRTLPGLGLVLFQLLAIVWCLNLFNFMDGIDGIAASEAVFIVIAGAALTSAGSSPQVAAAAVVFGCACSGFLLWNWPPARIFMGDVGSGYLGYVIGVLALWVAGENTSALWVWLILGGVFFVDATVTLFRRAARGERVFEAHRSHAYQWLARRWGSHRQVTVSVAILNGLWLLPCAAAAVRFPAYAMWITLVALLPLVALALGSGAGRSEVV